MITANGVDLYVEDHGDGTPVLLLHGWPDSARLWRHQVPELTGAGYRVIVPDLRGFGRSDRPEGVEAYKMRESVADINALLDALDIGQAHVVGHDWGAALAWVTAAMLPHRVRSLTAISVPHPNAPRTRRQLEMAWYTLFFQFNGIAEATVSHDDWAWLRTLTDGGHPDLDQAIADLSRPGALTASLNWYRANLAPRMPGPPPELPVTVPTLGIWSDGDLYLDGERMRASGQFVTAQWWYEQIDGASHWIPLTAPDKLTSLLLNWLEK